MKPRTGFLAAIVSLAVIVTLVIALSPPTAISQSTLQWQLVLTPDCHSPVERTFPSGVNVSVQASTTAPAFSPGGVWVNLTGPTTLQAYSGYTSVDSRPAATPIVFGFLSTGGEYSFTACVVGGAPVTSVYVNGTFAAPR